LPPAMAEVVLAAWEVDCS